MRRLRRVQLLVVVRVVQLVLVMVRLLSRMPLRDGWMVLLLLRLLRLLLRLLRLLLRRYRQGHGLRTRRAGGVLPQDRVQILQSLPGCQLQASGLHEGLAQGCICCPGLSTIPC